MTQQDSNAPRRVRIFAAEAYAAPLEKAAKLCGAKPVVRGILSYPAKTLIMPEAYICLASDVSAVDVDVP